MRMIMKQLAKVGTVVFAVLVLAVPALAQQETLSGRDDFEQKDLAEARRQEMAGLLTEIRDDPVFARAIASYEDLAVSLEQIPEQSRQLSEENGRDWRVIALDLASDAYAELAARLLQSGRATAELQHKVTRVVELLSELETEDQQARAALKKEVEQEEKQLAELQREVKRVARAYLEDRSPELRAQLGGFRQKLAAEQARQRMKTLFEPLEGQLSAVLRQRRTDFEHVDKGLDAVQDSFVAYAEGMRTTARTLGRMGRNLEVVTLTGPERMTIFKGKEITGLGEVSALAVGRLEELIRAVQGMTELGEGAEVREDADASLEAWIEKQAGATPTKPAAAEAAEPAPAPAPSPAPSPAKREEVPAEDDVNETISRMLNSILDGGAK